MKKFFSLAPVSTVKHISRLLYYISVFYKEIEVVEGGRSEGGRGKGGWEGKRRERGERAREEERKKRSEEGGRGIRREK